MNAKKALMIATLTLGTGSAACTGTIGDDELGDEELGTVQEQFSGSSVPPCAAALFNGYDPQAGTVAYSIDHLGTRTPIASGCFVLMGLNSDDPNVAKFEGVEEVSSWHSSLSDDYRCSQCLDEYAGAQNDDDATDLETDPNQGDAYTVLEPVFTDRLEQWWTWSGWGQLGNSSSSRVIGSCGSQAASAYRNSYCRTSTSYVTMSKGTGHVQSASGTNTGEVYKCSNATGNHAVLMSSYGTIFHAGTTSYAAPAINYCGT